jgi:hypothetical protein
MLVIDRGTSGLVNGYRIVQRAMPLNLRTTFRYTPGWGESYGLFTHSYGHFKNITPRLGALSFVLLVVLFGERRHADGRQTLCKVCKSVVAPGKP